MTSTTDLQGVREVQIYQARIVNLPINTQMENAENLLNLAWELKKLKYDKLLQRKTTDKLL